MLLLTLKIPFLIAAFTIWLLTDREKTAAAIWGFGSFLLKFIFLGFTVSLPFYGVIAYLVAWAMFYGLSYLEGSLWQWPVSLLAGCILIIFT